MSAPLSSVLQSNYREPIAPMPRPRNPWTLPLFVLMAALAAFAAADDFHHTPRPSAQQAKR